MCELLVEGGRVWNECLVRAILCEEEAELMCSLPISLTSLLDRRMWFH